MPFLERGRQTAPICRHPRRHHRAQAAEEARARLAAIVESSDDAIIGKTLDGIITSWNRGAEKFFGYPAQEAIGKPMLMLIPPERISEEPEILARIKRGERVEHFETVPDHQKTEN